MKSFQINKPVNQHFIEIYIVFAVLFFICTALAAQTNSLKQPVTSDSSWSIQIASKDEPGKPMIVSGTVYASDGKTPLAGIKIHVYHTDAKGIYSHDGNRRNSRLQGDMSTNKEGKYQFQSIKPASYPNSRVASHVHYVISGPGYSEQLFELRFIGDPYLSKRVLARDKQKGHFRSIKEIIKAEDGNLQCSFDIKLEK